MADYVILVEGNICSGKSSFCEYLQKNHNGALAGAKVHLEFIDPVALELFYFDRKKRAKHYDKRAHTELFENSCLQGRINRHAKAKIISGVHIFDKGMLSGAETFCKNSFQEGYLSNEGHEHYHRTLRRALDQLDRTQQNKWLESLMVYFRVEDVSILQQRQKLRNTRGESLPAGYLNRINTLEEEFIANLGNVYSSYGLRAPELLIVDGSVDFNKHPKHHQKTLEKILEKMTIKR
jgi:deoxyadenosine/deoxycytidine kinase